MHLHVRVQERKGERCCVEREKEDRRVSSVLLSSCVHTRTHKRVRAKGSK